MTKTPSFGDTVTFADVVHELLSFSRDDPSERLLLTLIDNPWFQRLRDVSQTANTRLVYMFSEHSRFGHCIGVAFLATVLMKRLEIRSPEEIAKFRAGVSVAALLHDIGHIAPGSHIAYKTWFPHCHDAHEALALRIIRDDPALRQTLESFDPGLPVLVTDILSESLNVPHWTWELISGGGWNVDRGNWCIVDSILAGVSYGKYNIAALTDAMVITDDGHLALLENRLDAMMHFAVSRQALYRQMYQHRVLLAADMLNVGIARRARDLGADLSFADEAMRQVLAASSPEELPLPTIFMMREAWWRYHVLRWSTGADAILADLSTRLLRRSLFKTVRIHDAEDAQLLRGRAESAVRECGLDPRYYLHEISNFDVQAGDSRQSMPVMMDDGRLRNLVDVDPLFLALVRASAANQKKWIALPAEAKQILGRAR